MSDPTHHTEASAVSPTTATASAIAPETTPTAPPEPNEGPAPVTRDDSRSPSPSAEKSEGSPQRTESPTSDAPDHLAVWVKGMKLRYPPKPALTITAGTAASSAGPAATSTDAAAEASDEGLTKFPDLERRDSNTENPSPTSARFKQLPPYKMDAGTLVRQNSLTVPTPTSPVSPRSRQGSFTDKTGAMGVVIPPVRDGVSSPAMERVRRRSSLQSNSSVPESPKGSRKSSRQNSILLPSPTQPLSRRSSDVASAAVSDVGADTAANTGADTAPAPSDQAN